MVWPTIPTVLLSILRTLKICCLLWAARRAIYSVAFSFKRFIISECRLSLIRKLVHLISNHLISVWALGFSKRVRCLLQSWGSPFSISWPDLLSQVLTSHFWQWTIFCALFIHLISSCQISQFFRKSVTNVFPNCPQGLLHLKFLSVVLPRHFMIFLTKTVARLVYRIEIAKRHGVFFIVALWLLNSQIILIHWVCEFLSIILDLNY